MVRSRSGFDRQIICARFLNFLLLWFGKERYQWKKEAVGIIIDFWRESNYKISKDLGDFGRTSCEHGCIATDKCNTYLKYCFFYFRKKIALIKAQSVEERACERPKVMNFESDRVHSTAFE